MRVIYIHQYFKTPEEGGAIRSYHLARGLVEAGVDVEMITSHNYNHYDFRIVDGIKVHYLPVSYDNTFGFFRRMASFLRFVRQAKSLIKKLLRPDLFYITSTPLTVGWIGLWAKKKFAVPYIFEVRDLWPEAPIQLGIVRNKLLKKGLYHLEEKIYRHALKIVALSPGIKNYILKKVPETTLILIPNFCDTQFFFPIKKDGQVMERVGLKDKFTIAYTGAMGPVNALHDLIHLAKEAQNQSKDWQFLLMGKGKNEKQLKQLVGDLGLKNVYFYPFGNKSEIRDLMAAADMAYISFDHHPVLRTNSPNKFFDAIAMGRAILINQKGWVANLVKEHGLGLHHHYKDHQKTVMELEEFLNHPTKLRTAQCNARDLATSHFAKERAVKMLLFTSDLYISEDLIVIGLDYFLPEDHRFQPLDLPKYITKRYQKDYIVPTILVALSSQVNMTDLNNNTLLAEMIYYGKAYHFVKTMMPCTPDEYIIGYSSEDIQKSYANEELIWSHFIENELLFETNPFEIRKYTGEAPFTDEISMEAPGRLGRWLGWNIVDDYRFNNSLSINELMQEKDADKIFRQSGYKPRR